MRSPLKQLTKRAAELESAGQYSSAAAAWESAGLEAPLGSAERTRYQQRADECLRKHREAFVARQRQFMENHA